MDGTILLWVLVAICGSWPAISLLNAIRFARKRRNHGCLPARRYPQRIPYIGSDVYQTMFKSKYSGRHLQFMQGLFARYGSTFEATIWGQPWIFTADAAVMHAINTTQARCFGVEPIRQTVNKGWMGDGIFVSDGPKWKESRLLFKPLFLKTQVLPLQRFDGHLENLFRNIPGNGTTIDLQSLFRRMVRRPLGQSQIVHKRN